ncbi:MAG: hypothetical protein KF690_02700 [Bacteroidetes bacterium]|nr:hypothetical protein [Bacteroidota bacterium]
MKIKVKKVSYSEVEVKHAFMVIIESQLKELVTSGLVPDKTPFRVFQSGSEAVADIRSRNQRVKKLLILELEVSKLDSNKIVAGEVLEYEGTITHHMVRRVTEE